jgi:hypothetical protein
MAATMRLLGGGKVRTAIDCDTVSFFYGALLERIGSPRVQAREHRPHDLGLRFERDHLLGQQRPRPAQSRADRSFGDAEHLCELEPAVIFPVEQLEQDLVIDRDPLKGLQDEGVLATAVRDRARRRRRVGDAVALGLDASSAPEPREKNEELVSRDREQVGAKRTVAPEAIAPLEAGEQCALHQVVGRRRSLVSEEPMERLEMALEQRIGGSGIALPPAQQ